MPSLTHHDYTIAWICALPLEMAAAKAILDEDHGPLPQPNTDSNVYMFGSISGHNVVIACLPAGIYGTISASAVVSRMLSTFPNIKCGLMVGIGGGAPSQRADIRLGDVVVSMPTATSGGVIQYDYGKTTRGGRFERVGSLNNPPRLLLSALTRVETDGITEKGQVNRTISDTLEKHQQMIARFSRPREEDWLFRATYDHPIDAGNCSACDQDQLVNRAPRTIEGPHIHYGLIASGNQLMKNAQMRDRFAQEFDILCFDMEAAGLMDSFPCLLIRGICDYSDSHKNKRWQGYAALAAAAYGKLLLSAVPVTSVKPNELRIGVNESGKSALPYM
jgi:nucleoside phosphorylase